MVIGDRANLLSMRFFYYNLAIILALNFHLNLVMVETD